MKDLQELSYDLGSVIYEGNDISIYIIPNLSSTICFTVVDSKSREYCRISMIESKYIGLEDERLDLNQDDINKIIDIIQSKCPYWEKHTNWQYMIDCWNLATDDEVSLYSPIPDYTKLPGGD